MMRGRTRVLVAWVAAAFLASGGMSHAKGPPTTGPAQKRVKITISKETTYLLGPLNADGTVNYVEAINRELSKGVTKDNNAAILLMQAFGPRLFSPEYGPLIYKRLGMKPPPEDGPYFVLLEDYVKDLPPDKLPAGADTSKETQEKIKALEAEVARYRKKPAEPPKRITNQLEALRERTPAGMLKEDLERGMEEPWQAKERPVLAGWLKANEGPLALVRAASERPQYYMPVVSMDTPSCAPEPYVPDLNQPYRQAGRAICAHAMLRLGAADVDGARRELMTSHRLARVVGGGGTIAERLIAMSIDSTAALGDKAAAASGRLTAAQVRAHLADLTALSPLPGVAGAVALERLCGLDMVMFLARQGARTGEVDIDHSLSADGQKQYSLCVPVRADLIDWDEVLRTVNRWYGKALEPLRERDPIRRRRLVRTFNADWKGLLREMAKGGREIGLFTKLKLSGTRDEKRRKLTRVFSDTVAAYIVPGVEKVADLYDWGAMEMDVAKASLALAAYRAEKGKYPDKLAELVPGYVKKVPRDIFSGKPLVYRKRGRGYLLYSIGRNLKDDGGEWDRDRGQDDIAARVE